jgi:hypothetical protein
MQLQLVVADFHLDAAELSADAAAGLPRLPGLEAALRQGRAARGAGWRAVVAGLAGRAELIDVAPARVAGLALQSGGLPNPWLATPVHQTAGLDHLRLHRAGLLRLRPQELEALATEFSRTFEGTGLRLLPLLGGFVLDGASASAAQTQDPALFLGADMGRAPPVGSQAGELRRLGAEIEMWLHEAPINRERARRGELAVNALWLWGGGPPPPAGLSLRGKAMGLPPAYADDAYVAGLWHGSGGEARALPADLETLLADAAGSQAHQSVVVVISAAAQGARDAPLSRLDARWLTPALGALRAGRIAELALHLGQTQLVLRDRDRLRFWRREQPWWQRLVT